MALKSLKLEATGEEEEDDDERRPRICRRRFLDGKLGRGEEEGGGE